MKTGNRALWAATIGLAGLAGCNHIVPTRPASRTPAPATTMLDDNRPSPKLSPSQAADVEVALGRSLLVQGDAEKAESAFRDALKKDPKNVDAMVRLAILEDGRARFKESGALFRKALEVRPNDAEIHCDYGYSCYLQRRWSEAETSLRKAIALKPDLARAHNNLGLALAHDDRKQEALAEFRKAGLDASDASANLAFALASEGRWIEARQYYGKALTAKPGSTRAKEGVKVTTALMLNPPKSKGPATADPTLARAGLNAGPASPGATAPAAGR
jgi:Tfp pilus assembly protein PilF